MYRVASARSRPFSEILGSRSHYIGLLDRQVLMVEQHVDRRCDLLRLRMNP
jgi:hypothetical protein